MPKSIKEIKIDAFCNCECLKTVKYAGTEAEFQKIKYWENIFEDDVLKKYDIQYNKSNTLDELIQNGYSFRDVNKILKEQMER